MDIKHKLIDFALCLSKFSIRWEGAGDVAIVVFVLATGINKHQIPVSDDTVVCCVVQYRCILAVRDNCWECRTSSPIFTKNCVNQCLQLVFVHAGLGRFHRGAVGFGCEFRCLSNARQFFVILDKAHLPKDFRWVGECIRPLTGSQPKLTVPLKKLDNFAINSFILP